MSIPTELTKYPQWVVWRMVDRTGKGPTKVPYNPYTLAHASTTDRDTWGTFEAAKRQARACGATAGLGFVFSADDPYVGVDMDACLTPSGQLLPGVYEIVHRLGGYVEFSPSDTGLHIIVRGRLERGRHTLATPWGNELAVYDRGRFFTMSGDGRGEIVEAQPALDWLFATYFPEAPVEEAPRAHSQAVSDDDAVLLDRMLGSAVGDRIRALWDGDFGEDHSAADLALCAHLAYWTGGDAGRIDLLFRRSGLMRDKWDQRRGDSTYGQMTIERALRG